MTRSYTAKYTKIDSGYMGQIVEWPSVVTEGSDIEECRSMRDALQEMVLAYQEQNREIPMGSDLFEQLSIELGACAAEKTFRGFEQAHSAAQVPGPSSFLLTAQSLNLEGPPGWSAHLKA